MSLSHLTTSLQSHLSTPPSQLADISEVYIQLIQCILEHNRRYYQESDPLITDYERDQLFDYLKQIESLYPHIISHDSPTQSLQGQNAIQEGFDKVTHDFPLLSLQNSYNASDISDFFSRILRILQKTHPDLTLEDLRFDVQPKYDGVSVELIYTDGILSQASTRGDGTIGEDITSNVTTIANLPHTIPDAQSKLILRGEIILDHEQFGRINSQRKSQGIAPFANTRNAAAGTIKLLDTQQVRERKLSCYVYDIIYPHTLPNSHIAQWGLPTFDGFSHEQISATDVIRLCEDPQSREILEQSAIDFDGLVIKLSTISYRTLLGSTDHHPRRAIAYKFPAQQVATQIHDVIRQVGRTGVLTPVAILDPVSLSGVTISRASLHNMDFITDRDIQINDRVMIQRSGEVIPYIVRALTQRRDDTATPISRPDQCTECGSHLVYEDIAIRCPNTHGCPAQVIERLKHFVSKSCMNIDGLGDKYITILTQQGLITSPIDIYQLADHREQLLSYPGFSYKRVDQMLSEIQQSKKQPLRRLLHALGLPGIGKKMAKELANTIINHQLDTGNNTITSAELIDYLSAVDFLQEIYGIGDTIIQELARRAAIPTNRALLTQLEESSVILGHPLSKKTTGPLNNIRVCITGSFDISRPAIIAVLENHGATIDSSPTQQTNIMLVGDKAGSKATKAQSLGITIYNDLDTLAQKYSITFPIDQNKSTTAPHMQSLF